MPAARGSDPPDALVGSLMVVEAGVLVELRLEFRDRGRDGLLAKPSFEGLLEALDLPGGLGMERPS